MARPKESACGWTLSARLALATATALVTALVTALFAARDAAGETAAVEPADAAVFRRIDDGRRAAARLRLDGRDEDWRALAELSDPRGDAGPDRSRDLVGAAIAPTETDLWLMLRTAAPPSAEPRSFYVEIDLAAPYGYDVLVELAARPAIPTARRLDRAGMATGEPWTLRGTRLALGRVLEARIPWSDLAEGLLEEVASRMTGEAARPWVRIRTYTWDHREERIVDCGPSVASYRLRETPYPLDEPLPERPRPPVPLPLPLAGRWFLLQGPMGGHSHQGIWAYDWIRLDATGQAHQPGGRASNDQYFAWDRPVFAPRGARVVVARDGFDDLPPDSAPAGPLAGNQVSLDLGGALGLDLFHLRRGSVEVQAGQGVEAGQLLGRVGNSGRTGSPHLHAAVWESGFPRRTVPVALPRVRVGLNPVDDDPWSRQLDLWEPREGMFVETIRDR
jgi:hypothetical protein